MSCGVVFDVKRFALHDGEGLRTTAFLKGCPLSCVWCQNPEGIDQRITVQWIPSRCIRCGACVSACPRRAIRASEPAWNVSIDDGRCDRCGICVDECPTDSLRFNGRWIAAENLVAELLRDREFFDEGGGVTLSGGEPLAQSAFASDVLAGCRAAGVHTAVETTLAVPRSAIDLVLAHVDQFIVDLKLADPEAHRDTVAGSTSARGVQLQHMQANLEYLLDVTMLSTVLVRIPMIPGFTATPENLRSLGLYVSALQPQPPVELLNFNPLAEIKYRFSTRRWPVPTGTPQYTMEEMAGFADWVREAGVTQVTV